MKGEPAPRLLFTHAAKMDIKNAARWYEAHAPDLGDRFLAAVDAVTERLRAFPESSPRVHPRVRRAMVTGFPYGLFYVSEGGRIRVIAVVHWRRDPAHWQLRIP
jgi:plasmid stabilization system protein ParE